MFTTNRRTTSPSMTTYTNPEQLLQQDVTQKWNLQRLEGSWLVGTYALIHRSSVNSVKQRHSHTVMFKSSMTLLCVYLRAHSHQHDVSCEGRAELFLSRIRQVSSQEGQNQRTTPVCTACVAHACPENSNAESFLRGCEKQQILPHPFKRVVSWEAGLERVYSTQTTCHRWSETVWASVFCS